MPDFLVNMPTFTSAPKREDYLGKANAFNDILDSLGSMDPKNNSILYNLDKGIRDQHDQEIADFVSTLSKDELNSIMNTYGSVEKYLRDRYYNQGIYNKTNLDKLAESTQTNLKTFNDLEFERWASNLKYNPTEAKALRDSGLSPSQFFARTKGLSDKVVAEQNDKVDAAWSTIQDSLYKEDVRNATRQMGNTYDANFVDSLDNLYVANEVKEEYRKNLVKQVNIGIRRELQDLLVNDPAAITPEKRNDIAQQVISQVDPKNEFGINANDLQESMNADYTDSATYNNFITMGNQAKEITKNNLINYINANPDITSNVITEGYNALDKIIEGDPRWKNLDKNDPGLRTSVYNSIIQQNNGFLFTKKGESLENSSKNFKVMMDKFEDLVAVGDVSGMEQFINIANVDSTNAINRFRELLRNSGESEDVISKVIEKARSNQNEFIQLLKDKMNSVVGVKKDSIEAIADAQLTDMGASQVVRDAFHSFSLANLNSKEPTVAIDYGKTGKKGLKETYEILRDYIINEADNDVSFFGYGGNKGFGNRSKKELINLFDKINKADPLTKTFALSIIAESLKKEKGIDFTYIAKNKDNLIQSDELEDVGSAEINLIESLVSPKKESDAKKNKDFLKNYLHLLKLKENDSKK